MGKTIGFVPTMGYLHEGHLSLVRESKKKCGVTIVSIFVNKAQFAPSEDFQNYPRDIDRDKKLLENEQVDYLFLPDDKEIYPRNFQTYVDVEYITQKLEGEFRPTHFRGVTTVVLILFNAVQPDFAFFGQKDAQQCAVIDQMVNDLNLPVQIIECPIVRDKDGLAMSSRNVYLSPEEKTKALTLYKALLYGKKLIEGKEMNPQVVIDNMKVILAEEKSIESDYIAIVNAYGFRDVDLIDEGNEYYILVACKIGKTRLIDNIKIKI